MSAFDTSGAVAGKRWEDLTPFAQGYVEALLHDFGLISVDRDSGEEIVSFSDLAPETLERIVADCGRFRGRTSSACAKVGALFWKNRAGNYLSDDGWMPLTSYLGDDDLIYLREAGK